MKKYHKIQTIFKRDLETHALIEGDWSLPEFAYLAENDWIWTEKIDGTNIRVVWDGQNLEIRGKTDNADLHPELEKSVEKLFDKNKLKEIFPGEVNGLYLERPVTFYGEGYGYKVQKVGPLYLPNSHSFILFDININGIWLDRESIHDISTKLHIPIVPIIFIGTLYEGIAYVQKGYQSTIGELQAEGMVGKPQIELQTKTGERIITKIKTRDFR